MRREENRREEKRREEKRRGEKRREEKRREERKSGDKGVSQSCNARMMEGNGQHVSRRVSYLCLLWRISKDLEGRVRAWRTLERIEKDK
jgi:hypothetical protein